MDAKSKEELNSIKSELVSIITELENISYGVSHDFKGIGNERCALCIDNVTQNYNVALHKLRAIDTK